MTFPCCKCCDQTALGGQRTCPANDAHNVPCVLCGQKVKER